MMEELTMLGPKPSAGANTPSNAEIAAAVEAIGRLHYMLKSISGTLETAKISARTLVDHWHALPGGVPREAAVAVAKLRLEMAHEGTLTLDTLRSVVEAIPVPEVQIEIATGRAADAASSGPGGLPSTSDLGTYLS